FSYEAVRRTGINLVHDRAITVNPVARTVELAGGKTLSYDRLILSPGIDLKWGAIEGYDKPAATAMPHAWKAGAQTTLLRRQLEAMDEGGTVIMSVPASPYRCPPGPYERASLIAHYLKTKKPGSKLLILDAKTSFSKQSLFQAEWEARYSGMIEWRGLSDDGRVTRVDPKAMTLETDFETIKADVANIIPPQQAGEIAHRAGTTDASGWCPIDGISFESKLQPGIHVIGDATIAAPMPKSAFSANLQGKVCAIQVARLLADKAPEPSVLVNTCYSYVSPDAAISIAGAYSNDTGELSSLEGAGGLSPLEADLSVRQKEAAQAEDWFRAITKETFG
ncbi:MAG: NAD(P)/FAD-dependent oxidoreductase, partial [Alphaproteobacteria bacterium]|nr:NAD(P)/FAD-dependent oxidoreductase [Alphaproteobacteria bacterium]